MDAFTVARLKLSVEINRLWIGFSQVPERLRKFVTPALFYHEGQDVFDLSAPGTAFLVRYRETNFAICTRHQLGTGDVEVEPANFTVVVEGNVGLSPNRVSRITMDDPDHKNLEDVYIAEYADDRDGRDLRPFFLDLDLGANLHTVNADLIQAMFALGFPMFARDGDLEEDEDGLPTKWLATARWVKLYLEIDQVRLLDTENRIPMVQDKRVEQETIDPDGMSGAPVFFIGKTQDHNAFLGFAGMVTNANGRRYMVYDAAILKQVLDSYVDAPDDTPPAVGAE